MAVVVVF